LLKREILFQHDLEEILGKRPYDVKKEEADAAAFEKVKPLEVEVQTPNPDNDQTITENNAPVNPIPPLA